MKKLLWIACVPLLVLGACNQKAKMPHEVYEAFSAGVRNGSSYEQQKIYFSQKKQQEAENSLQRYAEAGGKSREEMLAIMMDLQQRIEKCSALTRKEEKIEDARAILIYTRTDTCGTKSDFSQETVTMVQENDSWKIDDVIVSGAQ